MLEKPVEVRGTATRRWTFIQVCDRCRQKTRSTKKLTVQRFPRILVLRILLFRFLLLPPVSFPAPHVCRGGRVGTECSLGRACLSTLRCPAQGVFGDGSERTASETSVPLGPPASSKCSLTRTTLH